MAAFIPNYPELPSLPSISQEDASRLREWWGSVIAVLENRDSQSFTGAANKSPFYLVTNTSVNRSLDVTAVSTVGQLAVFVGTLAKDLKDKGITA